MATGDILTGREAFEEYRLSKRKLRSLREKGLIKAFLEGNKFLYFRNSIVDYINARANEAIPGEFSKMVLSPYEEKIHEKENNMRWKNGKGKTPRINMGGFSLLESKGDGGHIYYIDFYDETEKKRHTKNLSKLSKELGIDRGVIADRKAAEIMGRKVRNALYEKEKVQDLKKKDITFREFAEIYLAAQSGKKANSLKTVQAAITGSLVPFFGDLRLSGLNLEKTLQYVQDCREERIKNGEIEKHPIKDSTISNYLTVFGSMINFADRYEYDIKRKGNIIHFRDYHLKTEMRDRELEPGEQIELFKIANSFWKRLLRIALDTGLRLGNICGLQWSWIDFDSKMIIIPAKEAKGKKDIKIHMTSLVVEILKHIKGENPEDKFVFMRKVNGSGRQPLNERWIQGEFKNQTEKVGIEDLHFHDLRRTFAMRLVRKGVDVLTLKGCMGHANINSTMHYVTEDPKLVREAFLSLDQEIGVT